MQVSFLPDRVTLGLTVSAGFAVDTPGVGVGVAAGRAGEEPPATLTVSWAAAAVSKTHVLYAQTMNWPGFSKLILNGTLNVVAGPCQSPTTGWSSFARSAIHVLFSCS